MRLLQPVTLNTRKKVEMEPAYLQPGPLAFLWRAILRLMGWRIEANLPATPKFVLVIAPHTSNWDFVIGLLASYAIGIPKPRWVGKDSLFKPPLGWIMRALGGIPVDRSVRQNFVDQVAARFAAEDTMILAIAPEGTRSHTDYWRSGFYYIAHSARVPIVLAYLDFARKVAGIGPIIQPTGDIHADFATIRAFYSTIQGKYPARQGEIRLRPARDEDAAAQSKES
jgi:1-acyl-sn-glycerol-3-phosphate acyltransferase